MLAPQAPDRGSPGHLQKGIEMDAFMKLSREVQVVLAGSVLYLIASFLDWQQVSFSGFSAGVTEWHGVGVIAGLLVIALLVWELARRFSVEIPLGPLTPGLLSVGLALMLLIFTVITFLSHSTARHWPAWLGLLLSIAIGTAAVRRAKSEGVEVPKMPTTAIGGSGSTAHPSPPPSPSAPPADTTQEHSGDTTSST